MKILCFTSTGFFLCGLAQSDSFPLSAGFGGGLHLKGNCRLINLWVYIILTLASPRTYPMVRHGGLDRAGTASDMTKQKKALQLSKGFQKVYMNQYL